MQHPAVPRRVVRIWHGALLLAASTGVASLAVAQSGQGETTAARETVARSTLIGVVRDSLGSVVPGATVRGDGGRIQTTTDSVGRFRLAGVPAGTSRVDVRQRGYTRLVFDFEIAPALTIELSLRPVAEPVLSHVVVDAVDSVGIPGRRTVIEGRVVNDTGGAAVAGVSVDGMSTVVAATTGAHGRFQLANVDSPCLPALSQVPYWLGVLIDGVTIAAPRYRAGSFDRREARPGAGGAHEGQGSAPRFSAADDAVWRNSRLDPVTANG